MESRRLCGNFPRSGGGGDNSPLDLILAAASSVVLSFTHKFCSMAWFPSGEGESIEFGVVHSILQTVTNL